MTARVVIGMKTENLRKNIKADHFSYKVYNQKNNLSWTASHLSNSGGRRTYNFNIAVTTHPG